LAPAADARAAATVVAFMMRFGVGLDDVAEVGVEVIVARVAYRTEVDMWRGERMLVGG
jgi:hypothetical protein